jgi:NADH-quinone oxidoreductase subunit L
LIGLVGLLVVHILYKVKPELPGKLAIQFHGLYNLVVNKYWVDQIYGAVIVTPLLLFSRYILKALIDRGIIDGAGFAAGATAQGFGAIVQRVQSGNIRSYAGWLAVGAAVLLIAVYFGFTAHF